MDPKLAHSGATSSIVGMPGTVLNSHIYRISFIFEELTLVKKLDPLSIEIL